MKKITLILVVLAALIFSCQKEKIALSNNAKDLFYVENEGAEMAVLVEGNTRSKVMILIVHGGPGGTAIGFQNDEHISSELETNYAVAYWEQRGAGMTQGNGELNFDLYVEDMETVISVLRHRYGQDIKLFIFSHSWGGLITPAYLTKDSNQDKISGWINVAGAHNYYMNDSLTRDYLLKFGKEQISKNIKVKEWKEIVDFAESNVPNYDYKLSSKYAACAFEAEALVDSIHKQVNGGGLPISLFSRPYPFSFFWMISNTGSTFLSKLGDEIIRKEYSSKLHLIKLPVLCLCGKYDFTVPMGLADEVIEKVSSAKKRLVVMKHSGHICMENEPELFYNEVKSFIEANR